MVGHRLVPPLLPCTTEILRTFSMRGFWNTGGDLELRREYNRYPPVERIGAGGKLKPDASSEGADGTLLRAGVENDGEDDIDLDFDALEGVSDEMLRARR